MHLILWRHAEAIDSVPDLERELTRKGHRQARKMAAWLNQQLPSRVRVIASPAKRAQQTASALADKIECVDSIAPGASAKPRYLARSMFFHGSAISVEDTGACPGPRTRKT